MPELPEVETMRRGILSIVGSRVLGVVREKCDCRPIQVVPNWVALSKRATGKIVDAVDRIGKRVCIRLRGGENLILEPRMTGLVLVSDPPNQTHLRLRIDLQGGKTPHVWFWDQRGLGLAKIYSDDELAKVLGRDRVGPDALAITADELGDRMGSVRRAIKPALLEQKYVAGVGNLYASEICHRVGIHPGAICNRLKAADWKAIHAVMIEVLREAILHEGSTLSDGTYRNALNESGGYQNCHRVYDREGEPCRTCNRGAIQRIVQAQRSTFFCSLCQRRGRPAKPLISGQSKGKRSRQRPHK